VTIVSPLAPFDPGALDPDAMAVVERLQRAGHTTYFVGGCVRDLLLGREPKDFDVATAARPEEVKRVFGRRCRIIGRRFKLAHVHVGPKIFEVATFRGIEQDVDDPSTGIVVRSNSFGPPEEDARTRDFTVNGLFYDPFSRELLDWVDGRIDIEGRTMRTIGDAEQRLREDPVRLLRAIKLAARLDFAIHPDIVASSSDIAPLIATCPVARVTEELLRISESGHARRSFEWMAELNVLGSLLPEIQAHFAPDAESGPGILDWFDQIDRLTHVHGTLPRDAVYTLLAWPFVRQALDGRRDLWRLDWGKFARAATRELALRLAIPIRYRQTLTLTADLVRRITRPKPRPPGRGQLRSRALGLALTVVRLEFVAGRDGREGYDLWCPIAERAGVWAAPFEPRPDELPEPPPSPAPRRRR